MVFSGIGAGALAFCHSSSLACRNCHRFRSSRTRILSDFNTDGLCWREHDITASSSSTLRFRLAIGMLFPVHNVIIKSHLTSPPDGGLRARHLSSSDVCSRRQGVAPIKKVSEPPSSNTPSSVLSIANLISPARMRTNDRIEANRSNRSVQPGNSHQSDSGCSIGIQLALLMGQGERDKAFRE